MQDTPSADPRDQAIRAALRDAATLAAMVVTEFTASYWGAEPAVYVPTLAAYVTDLGGHLEEAARGTSSPPLTGVGSPFGSAR